MNYFFRSTLGAHRLLFTPALLALLALFLWQCGSDDNSTAPQNAAASTTENTPPADNNNTTDDQDPNNGDTEESTGPEAILNGQYIQSLQITGGPWQADGPDQEVVLTIGATGLAGVKQLEMVFAFQPPEMFDLDAAVFKPTQPAFITVGSGLESAGDAQLRAGAISFQEQNGEMILGTLRLKLNNAFTDQTQATVRLVLVSIGPSSLEREIFESEVAQLEALIE